MKTLAILFTCLFTGAVLSAPANSTTQGSKKNEYSVTVTDNGKEKEEVIVIDEDKNVEIFKTVDSDDAEIVEDFDAGLEGIIPTNGPCYVKPLDNDENTDPAELKSKIESEEAHESKDEKEGYYTLAGRPIKNRAVVGETIDSKCEGRNIYWIASVPHGDGGRDKRGCFYYRYCRYTYIGYGWWRYRCWYIWYC